jgi:uncharacterized protein (TIGR04255 family)
MSDQMVKLKNAPIVEAVVDIECDMPPSLDISTLETAARDAYRPQYPKFRKIYQQRHVIQAAAKPNEPPQSSIEPHAVRGFQFVKDDEKQLLQVRAEGFSFNRLAPYSTLDDYLPDIQNSWVLFTKLSSPVQVRAVRLRYINRIALPLSDGKVDLDHYLKLGPISPCDGKLRLIGFVNQYVAKEPESGDQVNIILAAQPVENNMLPVIFDITTSSQISLDPSNWPAILSEIQSLRHLKNEVFRNTITEPCLNLFQG